MNEIESKLRSFKEILKKTEYNRAAKKKNGVDDNGDAAA